MIHELSAAREPGPEEIEDVLHSHAANVVEVRLPTGHTLQQLGFGLRAAGSDLWDKHAIAAGELLERFAWNPDEFMLFRLDVSFPVWNAFYYMDFDFQSDGAQ